MVTRNSLIVLLVIFLVGCSSASPTPTVAPASETPPPPATSTPAPDYVAMIRNAQYQLGIADVPRLVQLTDGKFEEGSAGGADYVSVNVTDFIASGDLNNDGVNEIAALIAENYGGSGTFVFLTIFSNANGTLTFQTSTLVDDRPMLNTLSIQDGEVYLEATIHASEDPFCCPTLQTARHYRLIAPNLMELTDYSTLTPTGKARVINIEVPVNNTEAYSSVQFRGSVTVAPFENNLTYRIYDLVGVELAVGSINVVAPELGGPGTFDTIISLGNILSGSVVKVEIQDISAADGSLFAMDSVELVVK